MTAIVDDFAAIRGATAHVTVGDADAGEPIRLFREWVAAMHFCAGIDDEENPESRAGWARLDAIERESARCLRPQQGSR